MSIAPIFDFHARLASRPDALDRLLATMDAAGIGRAAVAAGSVLDLDRLSRQIVHGGGCAATPDNATVLAACRAAPGRLAPFYFANPYQPVSAYREVAAEFRGLEISPAVHGVGFADRRVEAIVEVAASLGQPVYAACVPTPGGRTDDFVALARRFPETTFVFGHCGFIGIDLHALHQISPHGNIAAETSGCLSVVARAAVQRLGADRVLFGTEYPLQHPRVELAKLAGLELAATDLAKVAWRNAHRLLKEEPDDNTIADRVAADRRP